MASNELGPNVNAWHGFGVEFMCTFFLLLVVMAASDSAKKNRVCFVVVARLFAISSTCAL